MKQTYLCIKSLAYEHDFCFITKVDGEIILKPTKFHYTIKNLNNITQLNHLFSFDICILNNEEILTYNPIQAALNSKEPYKSEVNFQTGENEYRKMILTSFLIEEDKRIFCLNDVFNDREKLEILEKENTELKNLHQETFNLKNKAQSQATRLSILNQIAFTISDILEIDKIIQLALKELKSFLVLEDANYYSVQNHDLNGVSSISQIRDDEQINKVINTPKTSISVFHKDNKAFNRILVPVIYNKNLIGIIDMLLVQNRNWSDEEITLIESVSNQLAIAVNQAELFKELETALKELKQAQVQLIQQEKMASLGQLVAGVAHEINTPLGAISSNNSLISKFLEMEDISDAIISIKELSEINKNAISRISEIVKSLKNFARLDESEFDLTDINLCIDDTLKLIKHEIGSNIEIIKNYQDLPKIKVYPNLLNQVLMNILVNAVQSIKKQGSVKISTYIENAWFIVEIKDSGDGIKEDNIAKIFDPGFTTKGVGVGTGLGLSISYNIIQKHKGDILVDSQEGNGTTFRILLPLDSTKL